MAIAVPIISEFDSKGVKQAEKAFANLKSSAGNLGRSLKAAVLPATVAIGGLAAAGFSAVKAAMEDEKAQALLARQLKATTGATDKQIAATEAWISKTSLAVGVADDELRPALAKLVRVTGSVSKAQKVLKVALNVSKGSGKSLDTVVTSISKAYGGNVKALARLEPSMKSFIGKTTTADQAVRRLAGYFEGAAATAAGTLQGKFDILKIAIGETKEQFGTALLPVAETVVGFFQEKMLPYVQKIADAFSKDGLSGAITMAKDDLLKFIEDAKGFKGFIVDLTLTVGLFAAAFKIGGVIASFLGFIASIKGALLGLGGIFTGFAATSVGAVLTALGLAATAVFVLIDALRDPVFRQQFGTWILDSLKLIGNAFILVHNTIAGAINSVTKLINKLTPGRLDIPLLQTYGYMDFSKLATQGTSYQYTNPRQFESGPGGVTINVSGGDPQAVVDTITRWYRQNGPNAPWMG